MTDGRRQTGRQTFFLRVIGSSSARIRERLTDGDVIVVEVIRGPLLDLGFLGVVFISLRDVVVVGLITCERVVLGKGVSSQCWLRAELLARLVGSGIQNLFFCDACAGSLHVGGSYSAKVPRSSLAEVHREFVHHILEDEVGGQKEGQGDKREDGEEEEENGVVEERKIRRNDHNAHEAFM